MRKGTLKEEMLIFVKIDSWMWKGTLVKQEMRVIIDVGNLKLSDEEHWAGLAPTWMDLAAALKNIPIASRQFLSYNSGPWIFTVRSFCICIIIIRANFKTTICF